ncbi:MAG: uncharacterized protein QOH80_1223 [Actinomycetota bacterium]|nr:uncharacterized protein [Actinomycetota bacterium]
MTSGDRQEIYAALGDLYDALPAIECRGHCWVACGPIDMSNAERDRIRERTGIEIRPVDEVRAGLPPNAPPPPCPALGPLKQCKVYELRPFICRAWGVAESMRCPHGCIPEGGWLSDDEVMMMLMQSNVIGGHGFDHEKKELLEVLTDPQVRPLYARFTRGERGVQGELGAAMDAVMKEKRLGPYAKRR